MLKVSTNDGFPRLRIPKDLFIEVRTVESERF